jgi:hypothetical protein
MVIADLTVRRVGFVLGLAVAGTTGCAANTETGDDGAQETVATVAEMLTEYKPNQTAVDQFFAYDNIVNVKIEMNDAAWMAIKTEQPNPTGCDHQPLTAAGEDIDRYVWRDAAKVTVSGSKYLTTPVVFANNTVQIKKKSYCGSLTTGANEKPSLKLKFSSSTARDAMGLQYIDFNNSKQDDSYIRQTLGYYLIGLAGLPHPRANYAKVQVVTESRTENFVYITLEPARSSFIENPANKFTNRTLSQGVSSDARAPGNLYEFEHLDDLNPDGLNYIAPEKVSAIQGTTKPDLRYAISRLSTSPTASALNEVVNTDQFALFWAMEFLLKHRDGYTENLNNTYIYNDSVATSGTQSDATVDFKFIPWGIDWILNPQFDFMISTGSVVGGIMASDVGLYRKFISAVAGLRSSVFSRAMLDGAIKTRIDALQSQLATLGMDKSTEIGIIRTQLKLARAAAIRIAGNDTSSYYLADAATGNVIHASTLETVPNTSYYEVYHRAGATDATDRWTIGYNGFGTTFTNEGYKRNLYASPTLMTSANHPYIFQVPPGTSPAYEAWEWEYEGPQSNFRGTALIRNLGTGRYIHFSATSDLTPQGRPRVYQGDPPTSIIMY